MMCALNKNAVIFKVGDDIKDPIVVIRPQMFNKEEPDSCIPLLGIYNGTHYQSVFPASKKDEQLTVDIVKYFPEFQGDFKSFLKAKHEKLENVGPNCRYEETASEQEISETQATDDELNSRNEETTSEHENSEIQATEDGLNSRNEVTATEQEKSEIQAIEDGINSRFEENSKIQATEDGLNSRNEETV